MMIKSLPFVAIIANNHNLNDVSAFSVCSETDAQFSAYELSRQKEVVLVAVSISVDIETLFIALPCIHCLVLSSNNLSASTCAQIFASLSENQSIRTLAITENSLSDDICSDIPKCLCNNDKITSLYLSANEIGDEGARRISEALMPCRCQDLMALSISEDQVHAFVLLLRHGYPSYSGSVNLLLEKAVMSGSISVAEYLINQKADVTRVGSDSRSLLHRAAFQGYVSMVELLLSKGADIFHRDAQGRSALIEASRNGHGGVVARLIEQIKREQMCADFTIHTLEVLPKKLLNQSTTVKRKGSLLSWFSFESTPTTSPSKVADDEKFAHQEEGFEKEIRKGHKRSQTLHLKFRDFEHRVPVPVSEAVHVEINQMLTCPLSPASSAFHDQDFEEVKLFLIHLQESGSELVIGKGKLSVFLKPTIQSNQVCWVHLYDETDSIIASIRLKIKLTSPFLDESCKLGNTALLEACRKGCSDSVRILVEGGAKTDCVDKDGNTPLIICSRFGYEDVCKILLRYGVSTQTSNRAGITALMAAQQHNFTNIAHILQCHEMVETHTPLSVKRIHPENNSLLDEGLKYKGEYEKCVFEVVIVEAQNLPIADVTGLSDPYCRISVNSQQKQTRVLNRNLNPRWNQSFAFEDQYFSAWERADVVIEVLDSNIVSASTLLGKRRLELIRLMSFPSNEADGWSSACFCLESENGNAVYDEKGHASSLQIKFKFSERQGQFLAVSVWGAINLPFTKARNAQCFCSIQYGEDAVETPLSHRTTNVSWNSHFTFKAPVIDQTLVLEICDNYSSKSVATETKHLAKLEISSNVLAYLLTAQLKELEMEIYALDGTTLKGPGGHISSLRLSLELVAYHSARERYREFERENSRIQQLPRQVSTIQYRPITTLNERRAEFPSPRIYELETQRESGILKSDVFQDGNSDICGEVHQIVLFNKSLSSFTDSDLLFLNSKHTNNHLICLHLDQNKISDIGATYISRSLQRNLVLQTLSLSGNKIGEDGATSIGQCLSINSQLSQLDLSKNRIKDEGLRELCKALIFNKHSKVSHLDVSENNIGAVGMRFLARLLIHNCSLQNLSISNNSIGPDGALILSQGLRKNSSLKILDISFAVLGDFGLNHLAQCLKNKARILGKVMSSNKSLQSINFSRNCLSERSVDALLDCLKNNQTIHTIYINDDHISPKMIQALKDCIERNFKAAELERAVVKIQRAYRFSAQGRFRRKNRDQGLQKKQYFETLFDDKETTVSKVGTDSVHGFELDRLIDFQSSIDADTKESDSSLLNTEAHVEKDTSTNFNDPNESLKDMLVAATTFTLYNLGDAVLLEHEAAYAMAQEAAAKLSAAADKYSRLEDDFYQLMMDENSDQVDIISAVQQLTIAREEILRAIEDSRLAEDAAAKCFQGAEAFAQCETEEVNLLEAVKQATSNDIADPFEVGVIQNQLAPPASVTETNQAEVSSQQEALHESMLVTESDDDLISSALEEFFSEESQGINLNQGNGLETDLSSQIDLEIEVCCSIALEELELCKIEIQELRKNLVVDALDPDIFNKMASVAFADHRCSILEANFGQLLKYTHSHRNSKYFGDDRSALGNLEQDSIPAALNEFFVVSSSERDRQPAWKDDKNSSVEITGLQSSSVLHKDIDACCILIKKEMDLCRQEIVELREQLQQLHL